MLVSSLFRCCVVMIVVDVAAVIVIVLVMFGVVVVLLLLALFLQVLLLHILCTYQYPAFPTMTCHHMPSLPICAVPDVFGFPGRGQVED